LPGGVPSLSLHPSRLTARSFDLAFCLHSPHYGVDCRTPGDRFTSSSTVPVRVSIPIFIPIPQFVRRVGSRSLGVVSGIECRREPFLCLARITSTMSRGIFTHPMRRRSPVRIKQYRTGGCINCKYRDSESRIDPGDPVHCRAAVNGELRRPWHRENLMRLLVCGGIKVTGAS